MQGTTIQNLYLELLFEAVCHLGISQANNTFCGKQFTGSVMGLPARLLNKSEYKKETIVISKQMRMEQTRKRALMCL